MSDQKVQPKWMADIAADRAQREALTSADPEERREARERQVLIEIVRVKTLLGWVLAVLLLGIVCAVVAAILTAGGDGASSGL